MPRLRRLRPRPRGAPADPRPRLPVAGHPAHRRSPDGGPAAAADRRRARWPRRRQPARAHPGRPRSAALAPGSADPALAGRPRGHGPRRGHGEHLLDRDADTPRIPASNLKLLSAAAVDRRPSPAGATADHPGRRGGRRPAPVVLVAGGDTLLAPGAGDPSAVVGRAGLGDLAGQVAEALRARGTTRSPSPSTCRTRAGAGLPRPPGAVTTDPQRDHRGGRGHRPRHPAGRARPPRPGRPGPASLQAFVAGAARRPGSPRPRPRAGAGRPRGRRRRSATVVSCAGGRQPALALRRRPTTPSPSRWPVRPRRGPGRGRVSPRWRRSSSPRARTPT